MDDAKAIQNLKKGDISGLEILITRYQSKAVCTAFLITQDGALAEDVTQDTFLRIFQRIHHFDEARPFEPYLLRSITHAALNAVCKSSRHVSLREEGELLVLKNLLISASTIEDQVEYNLIKEQIRTMLMKLKPRERAVIVERYYLNMSEKEMAKLHSIAPGTVKWLLNAARMHLRALIRPEGYFE